MQHKAPARSIYSQGQKELPRDVAITAPATPLARLWDGYGSALKPAWEPIIMARKPLDGTLAENVTRHGCGGLNVDGGRVDTNGEDLGDPSRWDRAFQHKHAGWTRPSHSVDAAVYTTRRAEALQAAQIAGRWPANLILSYSEDEYELRDDVTPTQLRQLAGWLDAHR